MPSSPERPCLLVFERGLCIPIPDLLRVPGLMFPVLGDYYLLDFLLVSLAKLAPRVVLALEERLRDLAVPASERWARFAAEVAIVEPTAEGLSSFVESLDADELLVCSTTFAAFFDASRLAAELRVARRERVAKVSVDGTPLDFYAVRKKNLLSLLRRPPARTYEDEPPIDRLFERSLHGSFNHMTELPGRVLLCKNLTHFYHQNLALARRQSEWDGWRDQLDRFRGEPESIYIAATGSVKNSLLAPGTEVAGRVENSVLYPGVTVAPGATVRDSVIMSYHHIGRGARLERALVMPSRDRLRTRPTIEERVVVGGSTGNISNGRFPDQIHDGITVLGPGVELPRAITVDQGCYLSGSYPVAALKRQRRLARGSSYLSERAGDGA